MAKFFLDKKSHSQQSKKIPNYRSETYNSLFTLVKANHSLLMQKIIRKIKSKKELSKEKLLEQMKQIKKEDFKKIVYIIMSQNLKISNLDLLIKQQNVPKLSQEEIQAFCGQQNIKYFLGKLYLSTSYQKQIQKVGDLIDSVQQKKIITKEKIKQRKKVKTLIRKQEKQNIFNHEDNDQNYDKLDQKDNFDGSEHSNQENNQQIDSKSVSVAKFKTKKIQKRTEFKKTGRNKIKKIKQLKKAQMFQKIFEKSKAASTKNVTHEQSTITLHPSWQAKLQQNKKMFIKPFQGKRTLL